MRSRDYDDAEWQRCTGSLAGRSLLTRDGALTDAGHDLKVHIESVTDRVAGTALDALTDDELDDDSAHLA